MSERVYIHELVEITGHNRARYLHHMTANWCPIGRAERDQLCVGVWATIGSTGCWPQVVNLWEYQSWEALAANFAHETAAAGAAAGAQDPSLAQWWSAAASLRRGGVDRILVAAPGTRPVDELIADGVRGVAYAHELIRVPPGAAGAVLDALRSQGRRAHGELGVELVGAWRVAMVNDSECVLLWALPDWPTWAELERAWSDGRLGEWRRTLTDLGADWHRTLLVDAPLSPLRIGRQPEVADRRPLEEL